MKEKLYTIPLNDAFNAHDECPFCFIERKLEQNAIDFILGAAYMESDIREATDNTGFCQGHLKKMHDYGNSLGNALMLKTHIIKLNKELEAEIKAFKYANEATGSSAPTGGLLGKITGMRAKSTNSLAAFLDKKEETCYVCDYYKDTYDRYMDTFFHQYKNDPEFINQVKSSNGFCLRHLKEILSAADSRLNSKQQHELFPILFDLTQENMKRIEEDISWFVEKFDYRNKDADWKNSKDAIPRSMQKLWGGYPADGPYKQQP